MKPKVYIETSVVRYLTSHRSRDMVVAAHQELTLQWWEERTRAFAPVISELVQEEAGRGDPTASRERLVAIAELPILSINDEALLLADQLVAAGPIPSTSAADALHIAIAAVNGSDFLLSSHMELQASGERGAPKPDQSVGRGRRLCLPCYLHPRRATGGLAMRDDPIVEEVRRIREEYARRFGYDLRAMADDLRKREQQHPDRLVSYPPKPAQRNDTA